MGVWLQLWSLAVVFDEELSSFGEGGMSPP